MTRHRAGRSIRSRGAAALRPLTALLLLALLAACATMPPPNTIQISQEAADYRAHARRYYAPPGPPADPWGPYIREASRRFDVPDLWIRSVMHQESGGHEFINGQFVTSAPGAMGLMQLMPPTYDDMRGQYGLGSDPFDPHDNIMAGAAYIRQMYDIYGSPGFLAAYNTGPGRLDDFLTRDRALPHETRQYVAIIGPQIAGIYPSSRSEADLLVMSHRAQPGVRVASARRDRPARARPLTKPPVEVAEATPLRGPDPSYRAAWRPIAPAPFSRRARRFHLIEPAMADTPLLRGEPAHAPRGWAIQIGAFGTVGQASRAVDAARSRVGALLPQAHAEIAGLQAGRGARLYRARLTRLSRSDAMHACQRLSRGRAECIVVSPDSL